MSALNAIPQARTTLEIIAERIGHQVVSGKREEFVFALYCFVGIPFACIAYGDRTITFSAIDSMLSGFGNLYGGKVRRPLNDMADYAAAGREVLEEMRGNGVYSPYCDINYNQAVEAAQNLIKGAVKITALALVTLSFYASISMGGAFYAIPVAVFCLDPQVACEVGSLLMLAYAGRQFWQCCMYSRKAVAEITSIVNPGMDKETQRALLAPYLPNIEKNIQISNYFGTQYIGSSVLTPIGFVAGYALSRISSLCRPLEQVQAFVQKHTIERLSDALVLKYAHALAGAFGYARPLNIQ